MESTTHLGLHSQTTRLYEYGPSSRRLQFPSPTGLSPSSACRSKSTSGLQAVDRDSPPLQTTIRPAASIASREIPDLGFFPLRSPLLRESLLVSFPPLIDMLKFSGWVSFDLRPQSHFPSPCTRGRRSDTRQDQTESSLDKPCGLSVGSNWGHYSPTGLHQKLHIRGPYG